jgi:hypothetical protein
MLRQLSRPVRAPKHPERLIPAVLAVLLAVGLTACEPEEAARNERLQPSEQLGLMTSLPLYWPLGADVAAIAGGNVSAPWQREVLEQRYVLVPLDTLSPIPGLVAGDPDTDPLAGLSRLAIIQPRGLAPADNVALDDWVRGGGRLLIVLDPLLTGDYDLPLGDPRRPSDSALIPPVLARWGLEIVFDEEQGTALRSVPLGEGAITLRLAGEVRLLEGAGSTCILAAEGAAARCRIGQGQVTVLADAALFEHAAVGGAKGEAITALLAFAFAQDWAHP